MTMVPAESLSNQQYHLYSGYGFGGCGGSCSDSVGLISRIQGYEYSSEACLGSDLAANNSMAEDESRTNSLNNEVGSSSKDNNNHNIQQDMRDEGWLQLSIGGQRSTCHENKHKDRVDPTSRRGLVELDLLPGGGNSQQARPLTPIFHHVPNQFRAPRPGMNSFNTSLYFQQHHHHQASSSSIFPHHQEISWAFRPIPYNIAAVSSSSSSSSASTSSSLMPAVGSYFAQPFQLQSGVMDVAGPSSDFRVIDPPKRPHSGIWFVLQASQNQAKEPFLPQIPKSYLRIKDGRMTVRLLMKYLVNKLRLDSESEIEITCRGQQLLPFLTLQHVRDTIWTAREAQAMALLQDLSSSTTDHVMVLQYGRSA